MSVNHTAYTARAHSNIALVKYWGKADTAQNTPAVGSISMTLDGLFTTTECRFLPDLPEDDITLNGSTPSEIQSERIRSFLDLIRNRAGITSRARIRSDNNFPTGAGLASSASGFAALTLSATRAAGLSLTATDLSALARRGSGSAARSIYGGFVELPCAVPGNHRSHRDDPAAIQLFPQEYWDLRMLILIISTEEKPVGSRQGMIRTAETSPYYRSWVESAEADLRDMRNALQTRDFQKLGDIAEFSCFKMHGLMLSARPALLYWQQATVTAIHELRHLRHQGIPVYVTIDAGPQVKALCLPEYLDQISRVARSIPGIQHVLETKVGPNATLL